MSPARILLFAAAALPVLFAACKAESPTPTPAPLPTPSILQVHLALELAPVRTGLSACASRIENMGILVFEALEPDLPTGPDTVTLVLGEVPGWNGSALLLGVERIIAAGSAEGALRRLTPDQVRALYSGEQAVVPGTTQSAEIWIPLDGTASRRVLDDLLAGQDYTSEGFIAPDPAAASAAIARSTAALGIIPESWKTVDLRPLLDLAEVPVLALTDGEPAGALRAFLGCLQSENLFSDAN